MLCDDRDEDKISLAYLRHLRLPPYTKETAVPLFRSLSGWQPTLVGDVPLKVTTWNQLGHIDIEGSIVIVIDDGDRRGSWQDSNGADLSFLR